MSVAPVLDEALVQRLMSGKVQAPVATGRGHRLPAELIEAVRRMHAMEMTDRQIGLVIGRSQDAVMKLRQRLLPQTITDERSGRAPRKVA